jgi:hypothetical protein
LSLKSADDESQFDNNTFSFMAMVWKILLLLVLGQLRIKLFLDPLWTGRFHVIMKMRIAHGYVCSKKKHGYVIIHGCVIAHEYAIAYFTHEIE